MKGFNMTDTTPGKFYIIFEDETIKEALEAHSFGFESVEAAVSEANDCECNKNIKFRVVDSLLQTVIEDITKGNV